jgi:hypothetical protein
VGAPYTTTIQTVRDLICRWFGGDYDPTSRSYRTPQVPNLGIVKRARPKSEDDADYYLGQPGTGAAMGSVMYVHVGTGVETREAIAGASAGLKLLRSQVNIYCFLRSMSEFSEDAEDVFYQFLEDMKTRIRQDRSLGSGGWEQGGFVAGEGGTGLRWQMAPPEVVSEMTTAELIFQFSVDYFEEG